MLEFDTKRTKKLKELERQYLESISALETSYVEWTDTTKTEIEEDTSKLRTLKEEHEKVKSRLNESIVFNTAEAAVLPRTITLEIMQSCIKSQK